MKTMRNEYRDLKKENDLIFSTLAEYDRDTITEIISVADNTRGIGYEIELIRKDLIAMAAQAEARRDYLPSVIGDVDVFKRNLLASMPKAEVCGLHGRQPCVAVHVCVGLRRDLYGVGPPVGLLL